jgi:hypothetical protein
LEGENNLNLSVQDNKAAVKFCIDHQVGLQSASEVSVSRSADEQEELPQSEHTAHQDLADTNSEEEVSIREYSS